MNYVKLSGVFLTSLLISSCMTIDEPVMEFCLIEDGKNVYCETPADPKSSPRNLTTTDLIGYTCVSPKDYAEAESHHKILHREIEKKKKVTQNAEIQ